MQYAYRFILASVLALLLGPCLHSDVAFAADKIGDVVQATPSLRAGGRSLSAGAPVFAQERLQTSGSGRGEIVFVDGTKFAIGPSASFTLTQSSLRGKSKFAKLGIAAARGSFRWVSGSSGSAAYALSTPMGTIGIRGTAVDITVRGGKAYVALLNGAATICRGGKCQTMNRACEYLEIGGGVSKKQQISAGFKNRQAAAGVFPYLANPGRLSSRFRVSGSSCLSRAAFRAPGGIVPAPLGIVVQLPPPPPPPPPPPDEPNGNPCGGNCGNESNGSGNGTENEGNGNGNNKTK